MAKVRTLQASFVSGEISPTMFGRVDTDLYAKGAAEIRNMYVRPQGGVFRREGLEYVDTTTGSSEARLIPFAFNDEQTYMLVFTAGEFKVYKTDSNSVQATVSSSPISSLTTDIIKEMNYTQSADTLILVHKDLEPIKVTRTSDTVWTAETISLTNIPAYAFGSISTATPSGNVTPDVTTGIVTLTGSGTNFTAGAYEGQYINMPKGGRIYVTSVASTTSLEGYVTVELANTSAVTSGNWELESGYEEVISSTRGWPRSVAFFKSRLVFGGLGQRPQTILMSKISEFFNFDLGSGLDDEAIDITLDDDKVNIIHNIFPGRGLQIFTTGGEFTIRSEINDALTPANVSNQVYKETVHGSGNDDSSTIKRVPKPVSVDGATVFAEIGGAVLRQFVFNETEQSFNATNISVLANHLINDPIAMDIRRANDTHPADFLYVVNTDGTCAVLNSLREQSLLAWSLFNTNGSFEDVAVAGRQTYFIVNRTINGSTVRYVEKLNPNNYMDASKVQTSSPATQEWSNLAHLEGETVSIRGDDYIQASQTVASGALTSAEDAETLEAGLNFVASVKSVPINLAIQGQDFHGEYKGLIFANVQVYESRQIIVSDGLFDHEPAFRELGDGVLDDPVPLVTGFKKVYLGGTDRTIQVEVKQDAPLEMNILSIHYGARV